MKIKEISYERIHNLGNFENEKMAVVVSVDGEEDPKKVFKLTKSFVEKQLYNGGNKNGL